MKNAHRWRHSRYAHVVAAGLAATALLAVPAFADDDERGKKDCDGTEAVALVNGKIHTMDAKNRVVSSVLIRNGKFVEIGRGSGDGGERCTKTINLRGRTALPGIIDTHNHIILLGIRPGHDVRLENANSINEALSTLKAKAAELKPGDWITSLGGFSRNQFFLADGVARFPTLTELDAALPNNPVFLFESFTGPSQTNTLGKTYFESKGVVVGADGSIAIAPFGGTGPSLDALFALRQIQTFADKKRGTEDAMKYAAGVGVTTHLDQGGFPFPTPAELPNAADENPGVASDGLADFDRYRAFDAVQALYHEGKLINRIWLNFLHLETDPTTPELFNRLLNNLPNHGDDKFRVMGIGEFTAGPFFAPGGASWQFGTRLVAKAGWRNENHSLSASDFITIIDGWKAVNDELITDGGYPDGITKLRWTLAHVPFITSEYLDKLKALGGGVLVLGGWRWLTGTATGNGPPFRTILDNGIRVAMHSDGMQISTMSPWINIYYAVTGKNARGELINAGQQITREEAIRLYTADAGWFLFAEDRLGTIEEGKLADLIVLNEDYFDRRAVPDEEIRDIRSVLTIVDGKIVHDDLDGKKRKYWDRDWRYLNHFSSHRRRDR